MSLFKGVEKVIRVQIIDCDYAPEDMAEQLPISCTLLRMIPGENRPGYWLAKCEKPIIYKKNSITHLVLAPRYVGEVIKEGMGEIVLGVAYVIDETLLQDIELNFNKCEYVAICTSIEL